MKGKAIIIQTDGSIRKEEFSSVQLATLLERLQGFVGGNLEQVAHFTKYKNEPCVAFCNEYGKLEGLPVNIMATRAWARSVPMPMHAMNDVLVGPVVIVSGDAEFMEAL